MARASRGTTNYGVLIQCVPPGIRIKSPRPGSVVVVFGPLLCIVPQHASRRHGLNDAMLSVSCQSALSVNHGSSSCNPKAYFTPLATLYRTAPRQLWPLPSRDTGRPRAPPPAGLSLVYLCFHTPRGAHPARRRCAAVRSGATRAYGREKGDRGSSHSSGQHENPTHTIPFAQSVPTAHECMHPVATRETDTRARVCA